MFTRLALSVNVTSAKHWSSAESARFYKILHANKLLIFLQEWSRRVFWKARFRIVSITDFYQIRILNETLSWNELMLVQNQTSVENNYLLTINSKNDVFWVNVGTVCFFLVLLRNISAFCFLGGIRDLNLQVLIFFF